MWVICTCMLRAYHRAWANESLLCETEIVYYSEVDYRTPSYKRKGMQPLFIDSHIFFSRYTCVPILGKIQGVLA